MFKKALSLIVTVTLIVAVFCGVTVKANSVDIYFQAPNRLVYETDELSISGLDNGFNAAKENATGLTYVLGDYKVDFNADFVQNYIPTILSLNVADITNATQQANGTKVYKIEGFKNGLIKSENHGMVAITLPFLSQNGTPLALNINDSDELNVLHTTYDSVNKTVTFYTDYFGEFYISDANESDFNYGKLALSLTNNSEEYLYLYEEIEECLTNFEESVSFNNKYTVTVNELGVAYNAVRNDHPEFFAMMVDNEGNNYLAHYGYSWDGVDTVYSFIPKYYMTKTEYQGYMSAINQRANELIENIDVAIIGEYEASKIVYERLCEQVSYVLNAPFCHTIYGSLVNGNSVCDGYARAYQYLLNKLGILAHTVTGYSYNPSTGTGEGHAWNLVRVNGEYYYTDVTWADQGEKTFYGYLNCNYAEISKDHQFNDAGFALPNTTALKDNYYTVTGYTLDYSSVTGEDMVSLVRKQGPVVQFKVNNYTGSNLINDLFAKLSENDQAILRAVLTELGYNSMRIAASGLGNELIINFYNESLTELPASLVISGELKVGKTLTVSVSDASYNQYLQKIVWYRNGVPIENANSASYILTASDIDCAISVAAYSSGYNGAVMTMASTLVKNTDILSGSLTISGNTKVGSSLTASCSLNISGLKYQWYRNGAAIVGATSSSYKLTANDVGSTIYCVVSANDALGTVTSNSISGITSAEFLRGDINNNGVVDNLDLTYLRRYLARWNVTVNEQALDVNQNGVVDNVDATYLARALSRWSGYTLD